MNLKERAQKLKKKLKTDIPAVFIAMKRKETPVPAKILAGVTIVYALSPIDLIPDFIPVLGYLDDILILPALIAVIIKLIPREIFEDCRKQAEGFWDGGKPKKWYYALPIILIWVVLVYIILRAIF